MTETKPKSWLVIFPRVVIILFFIGVSVGLIQTWLPAFGYLPAIGRHELTLDPWRQLFSYPGLSRSLIATLISGIGAAFLSVLVTLTMVAYTYQTGVWTVLERSLASVLSIPQAAFAIGFGFLIAPSGWLIRAVSPGVTGYTYTPDWIITQDPFGVSLMVTLCLKEIPFLLLVIISAMGRLNISNKLMIGRSLGYQPFQVWAKILIPELYPYLRLPVFAIVGYSLSVVDVAMIMGPTVPPTFAVLVTRWFNDPDLSFRLMGAAGATLLLFIVISGIVFVWGLELFIRRIIAGYVINGVRTSFLSRLHYTGYIWGGLIVLIPFAAILILLIWSFTWRWRFPDFLPTSWSFQFWARAFDQAVYPLVNTLTIGAASAFIGLVLVIGCLEYEVYLRKAGRKIDWDDLLWVTYLPLLIPQIAFIFGTQLLLTAIRFEGTWLALVWSHLIFVYPYIFLTLATTYRNFDIRFSQVAVILSGSNWTAFRKIKLPMLSRGILFSLAIGFSVSVAQYIPTVFIGAGRYATITTETVNLAAGSDRRILAVLALCQQLMPFLVFIAAIMMPKVFFRNRKGMRV